MQVVAKLQRQPVLAGRELHVDDVLAVPEVHPRSRSRDDGARREAVGVDRHVMVAKVRPALGDSACRDRSQLVILDAELEHDRALHGRTVLRLNKEHPWSCRCRLAARRKRDGQERQERRTHKRCPHSAGKCITGSGGSPRRG